MAKQRFTKFSRCSREEVRFLRRQAVAILQSVQEAEDAFNRMDLSLYDEAVTTALEDATTLVRECERA